MIPDGKKETAVPCKEGELYGETALYEAVLCLQTIDECRSFFTDLCTPKEREALTERWLIARLLNREALSYREISTRTGASTTTVGRVARFLQQESHNGYRLVLDRLKGRNKEDH